MKDSLTIIGIALLALIAGTMIQPKPTTLGGSGIDQFSTTVINTISLTTTVTTTVASNGNTRFIQIQNLSNVPIFCLLDGATAASASTVTSTAIAPVGFVISASSSAKGTYENRGYSGNVNCVAAAAGATTTITIGR